MDCPDTKWEMAGWAAALQKGAEADGGFQADCDSPGWYGCEKASWGL